MASSNISLRAPDGGDFSAWLAKPDNPNGGAIVVLQEIFGINANIRTTADAWASKGFYVIAPDLFWRQEPGIELDPALEADRNRATELLQGLDQPLAVQDALVAAEYLRQLPEMTGGIGAVGYCLGGRLAFLLAMQPGIDAAASYYGVAIQASLGDMEKVRAPLLIHMAEEDHLCPPEAQEAIEKAAASHADHISVIRYPGVGHAFARIGGGTWDAASAKRANGTTLQLLNARVASAR